MQLNNMTDEEAAQIGRAFMARLPDGFQWILCPTEYLVIRQEEITDWRQLALQQHAQLGRCPAEWVRRYFDRRRYAGAWAKYHGRIFSKTGKSWIQRRRVLDWIFRDEMRKAADLQAQGFKL